MRPLNQAYIVEAKLMHIISLGAGVQSSTMALMAAHGEITPMPDCAIFADTGWEPKAVYTWLDWLEKELPFPTHRVGTGMLRHDQITARMRKGEDGAKQHYAALPYFTLADGATKRGMVKRQCTSKYKIQPIETFIKRDLLGWKPRQRSPKYPVVSQWRGISADEAQRMKPSRERWMTVRYPLAMEHGMSRSDCLAWMRKNEYEKPPRSACIGCPFHSDHEWLDMRDNRREEWEDAVDFDKQIRTAGGMRGKTYLHSSCKPLGEVEFKADKQNDMFGNECEGMCGV